MSRERLRLAIALGCVAAFGTACALGFAVHVAGTSVRRAVRVLGRR